MYILLLFFLLILFGKVLGYRGAVLVVCFAGILGVFLSYVVFFEVALNKSICAVSLWSWVYFDLLRITWCFFFDSLSASMLLIISIVSLCVVAYSVEYMCEDPHIIRFFSYLILFTFFMIFLVTSGNIIQLFIGWEGVGICSYLLINFWFTRISANKSALLAVFVNKIGDVAVLVSLGILFTTSKTCDVPILFGLFFYSDTQVDLLTIIGYLLLVGAVAKSAQVGLHVWLPEAMEGPTPVSSLIHAATMVTAGIFLLVRFSFILEKSSQILIFCMVLGSITVFFGSSIGIFLFDIKRVVAYSTCSQLGYMLMACGFSNYSYAMFHLIGHAFFKALLFLTAGYIIHFCAGEQDFRKLGGILKLLPSGYVFFLIGSFSLIGFPFLSGFVTKEALLESSYTYKTIFFYDLAAMCQIVACFALFFSIIYSIRLLFNIFLWKYNGFKWRISKLHYSGYFLLFPLVLLSFFSIVFGYVFKDFMIGEGTNFWQNSICYTYPLYDFFLTGLADFNVLCASVNEYLDWYLFYIKSFFSYVDRRILS